MKNFLKLGLMVALIVPLGILYRVAALHSLVMAIAILTSSTLVFGLWLFLRGTPFFYVNLVLISLCNIFGFCASFMPYSYRAAANWAQVADIKRGHNIEPDLEPHVYVSLDEYLKDTQNEAAREEMKKLNNIRNDSSLSWQEKQKRIAQVMAELHDLSTSDKQLYDILEYGLPQPKPVAPPQVKIEYRDRVVEKERTVEVPAPVVQVPQPTYQTREIPPASELNYDATPTPPPVKHYWGDNSFGQHQQNQVRNQQAPTGYLNVPGKTVCFAWEACYGRHCAQTPCYIPPPQPRLDLNPQHLLDDALGNNQDSHQHHH